MKTVGLFEAKAKLSEICDRVSKGHEAVVITRRGQPLVRIEAIRPKRQPSVWELRRRLLDEERPLKEDLVIPRRKVDRPKDYLD